VRPQPARDDKVVAGWNGLAIAALAEAGAVLDRPELIAAAESVAEYLERVHWLPASSGASNPGAHVLIRVSHDGVARGISGLLEDYAFCAEGFLALYAVTGHRRWYKFAETLIAGACARFVVDGRLSDSVGESAQVFNAQGQHAGLDPFDNAAPSGAAAFAGALLGYAAYSGSHEHRVMASNILSLLPPIAGQAPRVAGWLLATAQAGVAGPVEAAVSGPAGPRQQALHRALLASPSPGLVVALHIGEAGDEADDGALPGTPVAEPEVPLLEARTAAADGSPQVYLCRGMVCDRPLSSIEELTQRLAAMTESG
jgi:uncharacterized protein YyaL (SSP411 family)